MTINSPRASSCIRACVWLGAEQRHTGENQKQERPMIARTSITHETADGRERTRPPKAFQSLSSRLALP